MLNKRFKIGCVISGLLFIVTCTIYLVSPIWQVADSHYSMLLSQSLWQKGRITLDEYFKLPLKPNQYPGVFPELTKSDYPYNVEIVNGHIYYAYPPGSSVLSIPFVALMNVMGISTVNLDGTYNSNGEILIEKILAALLMSGLTVIFFFTSELVLPVQWSIVISLGAALGTQMWSTASRALWSHTWGIFLLGIVVLMLVRQEVKNRKINPVLFASLLSWMYFVRPTFSIFIFAITVYFIIYHRKMLFAYIITGAFWFAIFTAYSLYNFAQILPNYYLLLTSLSANIWVGLGGILISPSRGLLIYVPILFFIFFLLIRYWRDLSFKRLTYLASMSIIIHLISVGSAPFWWGGGCYGPRLMTDSVPWFVLLAILGVKGMLNLRERLGLQNTSRGLRIQYVVGFFLLVVSMAINARGAISWHTGLWNRGSTLDEIDKEIARYWDWTDPQFLAGLLPPPLPKHFPLYSPGARIDFGIKETEKYLWKGWSVPAVFFRWTNGHRAAIVFALNDVNRSLLKIKFSPFLISGKLEKQRVSVKLNEQKIAEFEIKEPTEEIYVISLPKNILQDRNILSLDLPDAKAPSTLGVNTDPRVLGIAVQWFIIE